MFLNLFKPYLFYRFWVFVLIALSTLLLSSVAYAASATSSSSDGHYYYVEQGDTLSSIARRYGVPVSKLIYFNSLGDADIIRVGQPLYIPSSSDTGGQECYAHHKVVRGETLSQIAKHYGVDLHQLAEANHIHDVNRIRVGKNICIPELIATPTNPIPSESSKIHLISVRLAGKGGLGYQIDQIQSFSRFTPSIFGTDTPMLILIKDTLLASNSVAELFTPTILTFASDSNGDHVVESDPAIPADARGERDPAVPAALAGSDPVGPTFNIISDSTGLECAEVDLVWEDLRYEEPLMTQVDEKAGVISVGRLPIKKLCLLPSNTFWIDLEERIEDINQGLNQAGNNPPGYVDIVRQTGLYIISQNESGIMNKLYYSSGPTGPTGPTGPSEPTGGPIGTPISPADLAGGIGQPPLFDGLSIPGGLTINWCTRKCSFPQTKVAKAFCAIVCR